LDHRQNPYGQRTASIHDQILLGQATKKTYSKELVELLFGRPYCRIRNLIDAGLAKRQTASEYLKELVVIGVLEERAEGREKLYLNTRFWKPLTQEPNAFDPYPGVS